VRASTANRMVLWIVGCIGVFALLLFIGGDPDAREMAGTFVVLAVTIGGLSWLGYHYRVRPRRESFEGQARDLGFRAEPGDPVRLLDLPFTLFGRMASVRDIENTAMGSRGGAELVIADYWYAPSSDTSRDDYKRYTCILAATPGGWPDLSVFPEGLASRLRSTFAMPDVRFESEAFNRRFEVHADDRRFASAFVDARMMAWLLEQVPGMGFEVLGGRLMVFRPRVTTSVDDVSRALELFEGLTERVPRVVPSLFPGVPPRPDRRTERPRP